VLFPILETTVTASRRT